MPDALPINVADAQPAAFLARDVLTDDADCLARSISGWSQRYEQLKAGRFNGRLTELCLGDAQLFLERTSHALRQECTVPAGYVWFGLPLSPARSVRINGVPVSAGRIALHRGGRAFELLTPDDLDFWGIVAREDVLMSYARQFECESRFLDVLGRPVLGLGEATLRMAQQACGSILSAPRAARGRRLSAPLRRSLADSTLTTLFSLIGQGEKVAPDRSSDRHRRRLVERADDYVRSRRDRLVTVSELCTVLSCSRRALQLSFQDVLGVSPHAYIRAISLNGVRSQLNNAGSPFASVQDAAAAFGFWHMSQFARDYRQMFGERPSETILRRARPPSG